MKEKTQMDIEEFKTGFIEDVKSDAAVKGEGTCASFVDSMAGYLIDAEVLADFTPSYYTNKNGRSTYRVDGYSFDEFDGTMNLIIADFDGTDLERRLTNSSAMQIFGRLTLFIDTVFTTNLYREIEMSTPCADLIDIMRARKPDIQRYRLLLFTDAEMSSSIKTISLEDYGGIPVEGQIWDIDRLFRVCGSEEGRQTIEIDFRDYCGDGIPCLEINAAETDQYKCYLGVLSGTALADLYDKFGARLLEGNVRSFLSTKVSVNKRIRSTILSEPEKFFAFNNGIAATAMNVEIEDTDHGRFITRVSDFQIINGGQTTASISSARYKDKADLSAISVQMKLTAIGSMDQDKADELIRDISHSSNSQSKVSDVDFFASHPFHRRMEEISRRLYAPATGGAQYETLWFYERARGQHLQEQMHMTPSKKAQFLLKCPKKQIIKKQDLAKVQNTWRGNPHFVSRGAQTNFMNFAEYIDEQWDSDNAQFNDYYYQSTVALTIIFQYLENVIPKQPWYEGGYRANIICYTVALFKKLIEQQFPSSKLDLMLIWNRQDVPNQIRGPLISIAERVLESITTTAARRGVANVTQWCKREDCWTEIKKIHVALPADIKDCLISDDEDKAASRRAKGTQRLTDQIENQAEVIKYPAEMWKRLKAFALEKHIIAPNELDALNAACRLPDTIPNPIQSKRLLDLLERAEEEGFKEQG